MKKLGLFLYIFMQVACSVAPNAQTSLAPTPAILGPEETEPQDTQAQSTVLVQMKVGLSGTLCSGVLIAKDVVLTAAHCASADVDVYLTTNLKEHPVAPLHVLKSAIHPNYKIDDESTYPYDIALFKVAPTNRPVATFPDLELQKQIPASLNLKVYGFGVTDVPVDVGNGNAVISYTKDGILRKTTLPTADFDFSKAQFHVDLSKGTSVCFGDSGGPAFYSINGKTYLVGIASTVSDGFCDDRGTYVNPLWHLQWIQDELKKF